MYKHGLMTGWVTRKFSVNHFFFPIYLPPNQPVDKTNQTNVLNLFKGQRLHWELPPQQCIRKQRKLSKLILFSQSNIGRICHENTLGSLCTNQFAQRQCFGTRPPSERLLCAPQSCIHLDAEIAGSCVVLLALFDSDVCDFSDSISINLLWTTAVKARTMQASLTLVGFSNIGENSSLAPNGVQFLLSFFFFFGPFFLMPWQWCLFLQSFFYTVVKKPTIHFYVIHCDKETTLPLTIL